jgi:hypothetical protein
MHKPVLAIIHGGGCRQIENASGVLQALDEAGVVIDAYPHNHTQQRRLDYD